MRPVQSRSRLGLGRLYGLFDFGSLPPRDLGELRANSASASSLRSTIDEYAQANASMEQAPSLRNFADKPLVVLTASIGGDAKHTAAQNHQATLSTNTVHHVIAAASHQSPIADKEGAADTTRAILNVVSSVRSTQPLAR